MPTKSKPLRARARPKRHRRFDQTHHAIIETAVRLVSHKGAAAVSLSAVARAMDINRTTVYYHFPSRELLLSAVQSWAAERLAKAFENDAPQRERIDYITRFVLENPELIKLWIDDFIAVGDIRSRYPRWDALVKGIRKSFVPEHAGDTMDAEVYCVIMLTSAFIGPRVFKNSVRPDADTEAIVKRFRGETQRILRHLSLLKT